MMSLDVMMSNHKRSEHAGKGLGLEWSARKGQNFHICGPHAAPRRRRTPKELNGNRSIRPKLLTWDPEAISREDDSGFVFESPKMPKTRLVFTRCGSLSTAYVCVLCQLSLLLGLYRDNGKENGKYYIILGYMLGYICSAMGGVVWRS